MELLDLLKERYSCRKFKDTKVESEKINKILEAARVSPTACNKEPERIIAITSKEGLELLNKCKHSNFNEQLAFIISYDENECWTREIDNHKSGEIDATIVATQMMLEAKSLGIDSTWIMNFIPDAIKVEFKLDKNIIPVAVLVMGYSDMDASPRHSMRKEIEKIAKYM